MALGASLVCSVENTRWPVSAARMAMSAVSRSRISPTMMTSGSWRTMCRRPGGERQADLRIDVDLVDPVHLVFHRVFDGDDLLVRQVDALERGIERGGLAAAGRAGDQENAVRQAGEVLHARQHAVVEAQPAQVVEIARGAVEQAHHHAFAVERRQRGDAQVHFAAQDLDLDAAVLRQAALGDVQLGHQLQARDDGGLQLARRRLLVEQHAVHAEADAELLLERLDVDVAGALLERVGDHGVHQADDRRLAGHVAQVLEIGGGLLVLAFAQPASAARLSP